MAAGKDQPKKDVKASVAQMAKVHKLRPFADLALIGNFAAKFGLDPDWVYYNTSFGTIINFAEMWKEESEFEERYQFIWSEIHNVPKK